MYDIEARLLLPDGMRRLHQRGRALRDGEGLAYRVVALELLQAKLPPRITLPTRLRAERAAVHGDATQIHQLLMNSARTRCMRCWRKVRCP